MRLEILPCGWQLPFIEWERLLTARLRAFIPEVTPVAEPNRHPERDQRHVSWIASRPSRRFAFVVCQTLMALTATAKNDAKAVSAVMVVGPCKGTVLPVVLCKRGMIHALLFELGHSGPADWGRSPETAL